MSAPKTSARAVKAAMALARTVAERDLDPDVLDVVSAGLAGAATAAESATIDDLDRELAESVIELFSRVEIGGPLWSTQQEIARQVIAVGGLSPADLNHAMVLRDVSHGPWARIDEDGPVATPSVLMRPVEPATDHEAPAPADDRQRLAEPPTAEDDEIVEAEVVDPSPRRGVPELVEVSGNGQRRYRMPGGYGRPTAAAGYARSLSGPRGGQVAISTDSPNLADQREHRAEPKGDRLA